MRSQIKYKMTQTMKNTMKNNSNLTVASQAHNFIFIMKGIQFGEHNFTRRKVVSVEGVYKSVS